MSTEASPSVESLPSVLEAPRSALEAPRTAKPNKLEMISVESSNILAIGYTPGPEGRPGNLYVDFKSGDCYVYGDVPAEEFAGLLAADSPGRYLTL